MLLHRPDPVIWNRVICGLAIPAAAQVVPRPPAAAERCVSCAAGLRPERRDKPQPFAVGVRQPKVRPRLDTVANRDEGTAASRASAIRAWRSPGWTTLANGDKAHHPHPERFGYVLCGRVMPPGSAVERVMPSPAPCPRCADRLRRRQEDLGLRTVVVDSPAAVDRYDRARLRSSSVWAFRAGLPGLGRSR